MEEKFREICPKYQKANSASKMDEANKEKIRELQEKVLLALDDVFKGQYHKITSENFISIDIAFEVEKALSKVISIRQKQKDEF